MQDKKRIIFVVGTHPSETEVTLWWAQTLKPLLEARDFEVFVEKIPEEGTWVGKVTSKASHGDVENIGFLEREHTNFENRLIEEIFKKNPGAFIFDLHASPQETLGAHILRSRRFAVRDGYLSQDKSPQSFISEIREFNQGAKRVFYIEFPAVFVNNQKGGRLNLNNPSITKYLENHADLKQSILQNLTANIFVKRVAHLVDYTVNVSLGRYKRPRRERYVKSKKPLHERSARIMRA